MADKPIRKTPDFTTFSGYVPLAIRTLAELETKEEDEFHMLMGMSGEFGEIVDCLKRHWAYGKKLDTVNLKEEIGDYCWYIACLIHIGSSEEGKKNILEQMDNLILSHQDNLPTFNYSNSPEESKMFMKSLIKNGPRFNLRDIVTMMDIAHIFEIDFMGALRTNIKKLKGRYKEKFTSDQALNRDLESERKTLEE